MTNLAKETGISRQNIYQMFSENDNPTIRNLELLLKAMGYRLSVKAVGKGLVRG
jgi:DNA-binding phage protein